MSKIKNIHCFGTSYTAGGGFEWNTHVGNRHDKLEKYYGHLDIPKNQWAFSWPGRFQDILDKNGDDIKVHNHGKQGYGNQRVYRKVYEVLEDKNFDKDTSLFIIELSWTRRREFYYYPLDDYIICNYGFDFDEFNPNRLGKVNYVDLGNTYWYQNQEIDEMLLNEQQLFLDFMKKTIDHDEVCREISRNLAMFFSFLNENNIKYYISSLPPINLLEDNLIKIDLNKIIKYNHNGIESDYLELFIRDSKITIYHETKGKYKDFHAGLFGNTLIANQIFNKIVKQGDLSVKMLNTLKII